MLEKDIERKLTLGVKNLGGVAYKFTSPARRSVPDRMIIIPGGHVYFVEVKREKGKLTVGQEREIQRLKTLGCNVAVVYGIDQVKQFLAVLKKRHADFKGPT